MLARPGRNIIDNPRTFTIRTVVQAHPDAIVQTYDRLWRIRESRPAHEMADKASFVSVGGDINVRLSLLVELPRPLNAVKIS